MKERNNHCIYIDRRVFGKRNRNEHRLDHSHYYYCRRNSWSIPTKCLLVLVIVVVVSSNALSAAAWGMTGTSLQRRTSTQCFYKSPQDDTNNNGDETPAVQRRPLSRKQRTELEFAEFVRIHDGDLDALQAQAAKLRAEADSLRSQLEESKEAKRLREIEKIDGWIEDLLVQAKIGDNMELLKTVDQVTEVLTNERYSAEQVLKIFQRLCDIKDNNESRSNCSPLMELLVDATGKLDCTERSDNPNKRWNHKVERVLRKKLFARDWNIQYVSDDEEHW